MTPPDQPTPPGPALPDHPAAETALAPLAPAPSLGPLLLVFVLLVIGAGGAAFLLLKPRLAFTNHLAAPVRVAVSGGPPVTVPAGATMQLPAAFKRTLVAEWELVRPMSADRTPMGEPLRGSTVVRNPRGPVRAVAGPRPGEADYFAPLITNATSQPLRILVNAGLQGALDCGCAVRAGGRRVFVGYYRLYRNSTVQVRAASGATATFKDLGPEVKSRDGTLGLRFEDKDLRGGMPAPAPAP